MQIVQGNEVPKLELDNIRGGEVFTRSLMSGERGPDHFGLVLYYAGDDFFSPRHHHTFDQFRYQLDGEADFEHDGKMRQGTLGYFPEATYYGPTRGGGTVAVLQYGGPSGSGYMDIGQVKEAREALRTFGEFKDGVFYRNPGIEGKKNQDAAEAIWEQVNQRPIVYPKAQYDKPIMINTPNFPWREVPGSPGVAERALGTFTSCYIRAAQYRLQPDAAFEAAGRGIYLTLSGDGRVGDEALAELTTVYLDEHEAVTFTADELTEVLFIGLPLRSLMTDVISEQEPEAAAV